MIYLPQVSFFLAPTLSPLKRLARGLALLLIIQAPLTLTEEPSLSEWLVRLVPVLIFGLFALAAYRLVKRNPAVFFTPIPIFLAWSAAVFGIGPLYHWFAPEEASRVSTVIFTTDPVAHAWVALLNTFGLLLTVVGLVFTLRSLSRARHRNSPRAAAGNTFAAGVTTTAQDLMTTSRLIKIGYSALALALALRFGRYGLDMALNFPGFLSFMDRAGWVAVLLLSIAGGRRGGRLLVVAAVVAILEGTLGLMIGIRTEAVAPIALWFIGYYIGSRSIRGLFIGVLVVAAILIFVTPIVKEVRTLTWGGTYQAGRTAALTDAFSRQTQEDNIDDPAMYAVWKRLDYSAWQAAMMELYDSGAAGNTYRYVFWTFVPRFLAPGKPIFTVGTDIGFAVQGVRQSSSFSGTVFGEMYWNGGWVAVVISSLIYGLLLGAVSAGTLWLFLQNNVPAMLIGTSGLLYGFVVDETFSVSVVGRAVTFLVLIAVFHYGRQFLGRERPKRALPRRA